MQYRLRFTADQLIINDETIDYNRQVLNVDKLYIIKTSPNSKLKTPILLNRSKQIDCLDRRVFAKRFLFEIVKSLEICSIDDAVFIIKRVPMQIKYFVTIFQGITLLRWRQLLASDQFFISIYECVEKLISKKEMSMLRQNFL